MNDDDLPVTTVVTRKVRAGREPDYEAFLSGVGQAASRFPGHMGINVLRPSDGSREYTLVFRFDSVKHLRAWEESAERAAWLAKVPPLVEGDAHVQRLTGLEAWFALPGRTVAPPPRHKMALVSWIAVFPLVQGLNALVVPHLDFLPAFARAVLVSVGLVLMMTYVVMPRLTRWLAFWLYPPS